MATIQDIAKRANVSKSTVSRVLNDSSTVNEKTRAVVQEAIRELNYQPNIVARSLASGQSMTIGVLTQNIGSPYYDTINQGVIKGLEGTDYWPIFVDGQWMESNQAKGIETLLGRRVDGLVLVGGDVSVEKLIELRSQAPILVVGRELEGWGQKSIFLDNFSAGFDATQHLIELGHRRIAIVRGITNQQDAVRRYDGYVAALEQAEIPLDPDLIHQGDFSAQSGVMAVNSLLSRAVNFTAVFAANDMTAFGVRLALSRHGMRVPEDVSLIGFDDQAEAAFTTPPLTTVRQPAFEMGLAAADAIQALISGKDFELPAFDAELKIRESVTRLR